LTLLKFKVFQLNMKIYTRWITIKENYHPNAYLHNVKGVKRGLTARTKILNFIEQTLSSASTMAVKTDLSYEAILYHLHLLEAEGTVRRKSKRPYLWELTGSGQKRLVD